MYKRQAYRFKQAQVTGADVVVWRLHLKQQIDGDSLMLGGIKFQTVRAGNFKVLGPVALAERGMCRRLSDEEGRGQDRMLKFISYEGEPE